MMMTIRILTAIAALAALQASFAYGAEENGARPSAKELVQSRTDAILIADPKTILRTRKQIIDYSAAQRAPIQGDFEPEIPQDVLDLEDIFDLTLEPGAPAPELFLARYQSTAISFVDAYGNPWPIRKISSFLAGQVLIDQAITASTVSVPPQGQGEGGEAPTAGSGNGFDPQDPQAGSVTMTALKHGVVGNITVYLMGLSTPITIKLIGKPSMYHRIATMRVNQAGPQTDIASLYQRSGVVAGTETDSDLNNALYGVSPLGSETMVVQGAEGKAWIKGEFLYLQTPMSVFSPEILRSSNGSAGYRAYKLPKTTTVMGTNSEGQTVTLKILRHPAVDILGQSASGSRK